MSGFKCFCHVYILMLHFHCLYNFSRLFKDTHKKTIQTRNNIKSLSARLDGFYIFLDYLLHKWFWTVWVFLQRLRPSRWNLQFLMQSNLLWVNYSAQSLFIVWVAQFYSFTNGIGLALNNAGGSFIYTILHRNQGITCSFVNSFQQIYFLHRSVSEIDFTVRRIEYKF